VTDQHPPRLVYDDQCGFCTWATEYALRRGAFEPVGFSELSPDQRARLPADYERSAHLLTDDAVYSAGAATEQVLARIFPSLAPVFDVLHGVPGYVALREWLYQLAADNRDLLGAVRRSSPPAEA
jgi:predicted DCC family thiol-disulfide oxidoreductase YuxK